MKLRKDFKEKWVTALRSGKYKQGKGNLYDSGDNTFCCLGVAAHAVCGFSKDYIDFQSYITENMQGNGKRKIPEIIIGDEDGTIPDLLADMNDGRGSIKRKGFKAIATWIDKNL